MTKEELRKEAKDSWWNDNNCSGALPTEKIYECGYLAGAEPREKRIADLEAQIEKMKCCANCQTVRDAEGNCYLKKDGKCKDKDKWELRR